jgi:hypothetical protein
VKASVLVRASAPGAIVIGLPGRYRCRKGEAHETSIATARIRWGNRWSDCLRIPSRQKRAQARQTIPSKARSISLSIRKTLMNASIAALLCLVCEFVLTNPNARSLSKQPNSQVFLRRQSRCDQNRNEIDSIGGLSHTSKFGTQAILRTDLGH